MADEIVQVIRLQGQDAVASDLQRMSVQGQQAFQRLTNAAEQISQVDFDGLRNKLNQISNVNLPAVAVAAERTRNSLVALSKQAGQELDFSKPIEKSKQEISDLGSTSVSVFGAISNSIGVVVSGFEKLTSAITGSKVALSTAAIGGGLILGLNSLKNAIVGFSDASLADKLQSVLGDTVKKAVTEVDKHQKELTEKTEHLKHDTINTTAKKTEDISIPETKALTDLKKAIADTRVEVQSMQGEDDLLNTGLTELQIKALGTANAFKEMQSELDFVKPAKPIDKLIESFSAFGVKQEVIKHQIRDFAIGIEAQFEKVKKIQEESASKFVKSSLDVASSLLSQKSSVESLKGAELSLIEAEERLRVSKGGEPNADLQQRVKLQRDELAVDEAQLRVKQAKIAQAQAEQAVIDALKKASEEQANSLPNLIKLVQSLTNNVTIIGPKFNATAENIAHGFVASLGTSAKSVKSFSGSLDDLDRNAPQLVPVFEKLADLFKGTGDSALNARIANILFSGSIDDNLLKALSKGKKGLEDARNLAKTITDLQKDFSSANLLRFGEQLLKISDIEERAKKSTDVLGDTFGKLFSESISNKVGSLRQAVAPFDSVVQTFNTNIKQADLFKKSVDGLKESFLAAGISSKRSTLDFGLLISPAAIPIIDAITNGIKGLGFDFKGLAADIGKSVKPVIDDLFTLLKGKGNQVDSSSLGSSIGKSINEIVIPAFQQLEKVATEVGKVLSNLFGTGDISASLIAFGALITTLIGPFNALVVAALAIFGSSTTAGMAKFKDALKDIGINVDGIKATFKEIWSDLKFNLSGGIGPVKNQWIVDLKDAIVDFHKSIPGAIAELGSFLLLLNRIVGPGNIFKGLILSWVGALDIALKVGGLFAISLVVLEKALLIIGRISPFGAIVTAFTLLLAYGDRIQFLFDGIAFTLNAILEKANKFAGFKIFPEDWFTGAALLNTTIIGLAGALVVLASRMTVVQAAFALLAANPIFRAILVLGAGLTAIILLFNELNSAKPFAFLDGIGKQIDELDAKLKRFTTQVKDLLGIGDNELFNLSAERKLKDAQRQKLGPVESEGKKLLDFQIEALDKRINELKQLNKPEEGAKPSIEPVKPPETKPEDKGLGSKALEVFGHLVKEFLGLNEKPKTSQQAPSNIRTNESPSPSNIRTGKQSLLELDNLEPLINNQTASTEKIVETDNLNSKEQVTAIETLKASEKENSDIQVASLTKVEDAIGGSSKKLEVILEKIFNKLPEKKDGKSFAERLEASGAPFSENIEDRRGETTAAVISLTEAEKRAKEKPLGTSLPISTVDDWKARNIKPYDPSINYPEGPQPDVPVPAGTPKIGTPGFSQKDFYDQIFKQAPRFVSETEQFPNKRVGDVFETLEKNYFDRLEKFFKDEEKTKQNSNAYADKISIQSENVLDYREGGVPKKNIFKVYAEAIETYQEIMKNWNNQGELQKQIGNDDIGKSPFMSTESRSRFLIDSDGIRKPHGRINAGRKENWLMDENDQFYNKDNQWKFNQPQKDSGGLDQLSTAADRITSTFDMLSQVTQQIGTSLETFQTNLDSDETKSSFEEITTAAQQAAEALQRLGESHGGIAEERAAGGYISGPGSGTSDSIPARLSNGEYVVRASAVRNVGVGFMHAINNFSVGGLVGNISDRMNNLLPRFATGGIVASQSGPPGGLHPVTINFEGRKVGGLYAPGNVISELHSVSISNQISSTGRKPSHYGGRGR